MDIVFCLDNNYSNLLAVAIISILKNIKKGSILNFFVMHKDMNSENIKKVQSLVKGDNKIYFIQIDEDEWLSNFKKPAIWANKVCYYRMIAPQVVKKFKEENNLPQNDRLLFLDVDIIVDGDISPIFDTNISNVAIGAVKSPLNIEEKEHIPTLNLPLGHQYIYAGFMLYNIQKWIEDKVLEQAIEIDKLHPNGLKWADMDMINIIFAPNKYVAIHPKYSIFPGIDYQSYEYTIDNYLRIFEGINTEDEVKEAFYHPVILQLAGGAKPWRKVSTLKTILLWTKYSMFTPYTFDGIKYLCNKIIGKGM